MVDAVTRMHAYWMVEVCRHTICFHPSNFRSTFLDDLKSTVVWCCLPGYGVLNRDELFTYDEEG